MCVFFLLLFVSTLLIDSTVFPLEKSFHRLINRFLAWFKLLDNELFVYHVYALSYVTNNVAVNFQRRLNFFPLLKRYVEDFRWQSVRLSEIGLLRLWKTMHKAKRWNAQFLLTCFNYVYVLKKLKVKINKILVRRELSL